MPIRTSGSIFQSTDTEIFVTVKDLVTRFTGDTKFPTHDGHLLTIEKLGHKPETFIHSVTLFLGHSESSSKYLNCVTYVPGIKCNLCVGKLTYVLT
jgi:hypothetical protein